MLAAFWAKRRSHEHFSYGYHRVEVLGALASVMTVWLVTGILLFEAVQRIINPEHVDGKSEWGCCNKQHRCSQLLRVLGWPVDAGPAGLAVQCMACNMPWLHAMCRATLCWAVTTLPACNRRSHAEWHLPPAPAKQSCSSLPWRAWPAMC